MEIRSESFPNDGPIPGEFAFCVPAEEGHVALAPTRTAIRARRAPRSSPRVRFATRMFHPNISRDGAPYLSTLLQWHNGSARQRTVKAVLDEVRALLTKEPDPEPITHVNREAAGLCFSADEAGKREFRRRARRCAQDSNE